MKGKGKSKGHDKHEIKQILKKKVKITDMKAKAKGWR